MMSKYNVKIEASVPCRECEGSGEEFRSDKTTGGWTTGDCGECDGTGSVIEKISLATIQDLLNEEA